MTTPSSASSANTLLDLIAGHRVTAVIYVAAKLGIPNLLFEGPKTSAELAFLTSTHQQSLLRLIRGLVALGLCTEAPDGRFQLTDMGAHLASGSDCSLKAWALVEGETLRAEWGQLIESVRTGKTGNELAGRGQELFELMAKSNLAELFNESMASMTRAMISPVLTEYDFSGISKLMDVGGGLGELMIAILKKYPLMRGIVFDLPHCAEGARRNLADSGVADRCEFIAGSFFEAVPAGAGAIVMKNIICDWNDERCVRILQNCHRALKPGARLMVIDRIMPDKLEPTPDHLAIMLVDLNMLRVTGGSERTESEHRELLGKSGFRMTRIVLTSRYSLIEATVA